MKPYSPHFDKRTLVIEAVRLVSGFVFLLSGVMKIAAFEAFSQTATTLLSLPDKLVSILSVILVVAEVACGIFLLTKKKIYPSALVACGLVLLFIVVLFRSLITGVDVPCYCFGVLNIDIAIEYKIAFDIFLLGGCSILVHEFGKQKKDIKHDVSTPNEMKYIRSVFVLTTVSAFLLLMGARFLIEEQNILVEPLSIDRQLVKKVLDEHQINRQERKLILLVDEKDFSCMPCYRDFKTFGVRLVDHAQRNNFLVIINVPEFQRRNPNPSSLTESFLNNQGIVTTFLYDKEGLFERIGSEKTSIILVESYNEVIGFQIFPMGQEAHDWIINWFTDER